MKTRLLGLFLLVFFGCAPEPLPERSAALDALVAAERAFAEASEAQGMRAAFLAYLADESIIFRPTPTDGRAWFSGRPASPNTLAWQPAFADVADTGDFGYTTGPWTLRDSAGAALAAGHYVSVWRLQPDSTWRVEIDAGVSHAATAPPERVASPEDTTTARALRPLYQEAARVALLRTDRELAEASEARGAAEAFAAVADAAVRFYREGRLPGEGKEAFLDMLDDQVGVMTWRPISAGVSRAGDLGYTYGLATFRAAAGDTTAATSSYLRLWTSPPGGPWSLVLDLAAAIPPE